MAEEEAEAEEPPADDEAEDEEAKEEEEDDEDDDDNDDDDDDDGNWRKNFLLVVGYGIIVFFILTDPAGAAELGRNLGGFVSEHAGSVIEFLDAALSEQAAETP